ncbi:hypothetical protein Ciccas_012975, partial [Cichlidogyrus casuarinus]
QQYGGSNSHFISSAETWLEAFKKCKIQPLFVVRTCLSKTFSYSRHVSNRRIENKQAAAQLKELNNGIYRKVDADNVSLKISIKGGENHLIELITRRGYKIVTLMPSVPTSALFSLAAYLDCPVLTFKKYKCFTDPGFVLGRKFCFVWCSSPLPQVKNEALMLRSFTPAKSFLNSFEPRKWPLLSAFGPEYQVPSDLRDLGESSIRENLKQKPDLAQVFSEMMSAQPEEMRVNFEEHFHELCSFIRFGREIASALGLMSPFRDDHFPEYAHISCEEDRQVAISELLNGARFYPADCDDIVINDVDNQLALRVLRGNKKLWISALYCEGGRHFRIRVENYGKLPSPVHISVKLRQILYGIFLEIEKENPAVMKGFDREQETVSEWVYQFDKILECKLRICPLKLTSSSSVLELMILNGDLNLREVQTCPMPSWVASTVMIGVYWFHYTALEVAEEKQSVLSTFISLALFNGFNTRELGSAMPCSKLFEFYDDYAGKLKSASVDKTLRIRIVHALSELSYLPTFFENINNLIPRHENRLELLSEWELFPHNRLFHWMVYGNCNEHLEEFRDFFDSQHKFSDFHTLINETLQFCRTLVAKLPPRSQQDSYFLIKPFQELDWERK